MLQAVGTITSPTGQVINFVTNVLVTPEPAGRCPILHLELGPIELDLLGLQVETNQIVVDVVAQAGPGNLLGNLLCSVAHLLDQNPGNALAALLNNLLRGGLLRIVGISFV